MLLQPGRERVAACEKYTALRSAADCWTCPPKHTGCYAGKRSQGCGSPVGLLPVLVPFTQDSQAYAQVWASLCPYDPVEKAFSLILPLRGLLSHTLTHRSAMRIISTLPMTSRNWTISPGLSLPLILQSPLTRAKVILDYQYVLVVLLGTASASVHIPSVFSKNPAH